MARRAKENANVNQDVNGKELLHLVNEQSETKETQNIKYNWQPHLNKLKWCNFIVEKWKIVVKKYCENIILFNLNLYLSLCRNKSATVDAEKVASKAVTFVVDTTVTSCSEPGRTVKFHTIWSKSPSTGSIIWSIFGLAASYTMWSVISTITTSIDITRGRTSTHCCSPGDIIYGTVDVFSTKKGIFIILRKFYGN